MHRDSFTATAFLQPSLSHADWSHWSQEDLAETADGPGLLVSRMFWVGGGVSLLLWGCATWLVLAFN
jgi:hypothetical protein